MPRFAILEHFVGSTTVADHWDLLFAQPNGMLKTFQTKKIPLTPGWQPAKLLPDHRAIYLTYQGTVQGRGWIRRWDGGSFRLLVDNDREFRAIIHGTNLSGVVAFEKCPHSSNKSNMRWKMQYRGR